MITELNRRDFLKTSAAGVGFVLTFRIAGDGLTAASAAQAWEPNAAFSIDPSGIITVHITKAEMGQGVGTALAQIVAEELEADWRDVRIDYPTSDPKWGLMLTGGSWSVNWTFDALSRAGAGARAILVDAGARAMGVQPSDCIAENSRVRHLPSGRNMTYGEIVSKGLVTATLSDEELKKIQLKKASEYKVVGKWVQRLDIPEKTNGRAKYGIDRFLPGMVYAKVAYPPTRSGSKHKAVDDSAAKQVKGYVQTVVTDDLVAVIADSYENAVKARDALKITWDTGKFANVSTESIMQEYWNRAKNDTSSPSWVDVGDVNEAFKKAMKTHEAAFWTDYVAHAPMEPMNCVARFNAADNSYDFFSGNQFQTRAMGDLSKKFGAEPNKIRVHQQYLGGGFGRRLEPDYMLEAGIIAKATGKPVKLILSREEDLRRDFLRSCTLQVMKGGLGSSGQVVAWQNQLVAAYPSDRYGGTDKQGRDQFSLNGSDHYYDIPNQFVRAIRSETGMEVGYVRAVAPNFTFFAVETFMDELAHEAGVDPLQFRLSMLGGAPRLANVLKLVAEKAGWGRQLPPNTGLGLAGVSAQEKASPTWTATAIQARVDPSSGAVRVEKIWCAVDAGLVINPDGVRNQMEGSLLFGMSNALKERATVKGGQLVQSNFHDYQVLRMAEIPDEVNVYVIQSTEFPTGVGEPGVTTILPALSNAIFAATGARVRTAPYLPERVLQAIKEKKA
jgi:isoquinoline 1-oxidoreductase